MTATQEKLMQLIDQHRGYTILPYDQHQELQDDYGLYGDDACEFLIAFSKTFNLTIAKDFNVAPFFDDESAGCILFLYRIFKGKSKGIYRNRKSFNLGHLEKAIAKGSLDNSIFND
jgi:hypothetical protein